MDDPFQMQDENALYEAPMEPPTDNEPPDDFFDELFDQPIAAEEQDSHVEKPDRATKKNTISRPLSARYSSNVERETIADEDVLNSESFPLVPLERIEGISLGSKLGILVM